MYNKLISKLYINIVSVVYINICENVDMLSNRTLQEYVSCKSITEWQSVKKE